MSTIDLFAIISVALTFPISNSKIQPTLRTYANPLSCYQVVMPPSWQLSPVHYHYSRPHHAYKFPLSPIVLNSIFITMSNPNKHRSIPPDLRISSTAHDWNHYHQIYLWPIVSDLAIPFGLQLSLFVTVVHQTRRD